MAGTIAGGKAAAKTNKELYGKDWFARIGAKGGAKSSTGGFAQAIPCKCSVIKGKHSKRQCAGRIGGMKSKRGAKHVELATV